jgi:hypothetical protein
LLLLADLHLERALRGKFDPASVVQQAPAPTACHV